MSTGRFIMVTDHMEPIFICLYGRFYDPFSICWIYSVICFVSNTDKTRFWLTSVVKTRLRWYILLTITLITQVYLFTLKLFYKYNRSNVVWLFLHFSQITSSKLTTFSSNINLNAVLFTSLFHETFDLKCKLSINKFVYPVLIKIIYFLFNNIPLVKCSLETFLHLIKNINSILVDAHARPTLMYKSKNISLGLWNHTDTFFSISALTA